MRLAGYLVCAAGLLGCSPRNNGTLLVARIATDFAVPAEVDAIIVDAVPERGPPVRELYPLTAAAALPLTVGLRPEGAPALGVRITVSALKESVVLVSQTARVAFVPGQARELALLLSRDCLDPGACPTAGTSCVAGRRCLPESEVAPLRPYGAADARVEGGVEGGVDDGGDPADGAAPDAGTPDAGAPDARPDAAADAGPRDGRPSGGRWQQVPTPNAVATLNGVWPLRADDVWVVGAVASAGVAYHYAQGTWSESTLPALTPALYAVWASASNDVWAAGLGGRILRFDGATWTSTEIAALPGSPLPPTLSGLWGSAPDDIWAVGAAGTIVHGGRAGFTRVDAGLTTNLFGVWGTADGEVWVVGEGGTVLRRVGSTFVAQRHGFGQGQLYAVWSSSRSDVWAVGFPPALHYDGAGFSALPPALDLAFSVWGSAPDDVWAVGRAAGTNIARFDGVAWSAVPSPVGGTLSSVRGASPTDVWAVGAGGVVLRLQPP